MTLGNRNLLRHTVERAAIASTSYHPRQVFRSDTRWGRSVLEWPSLEAFLGAAEVQNGVHSIPLGEFAGKQINYDFLITAKPGTVLLCHFHAAAPQGGITLPIFGGMGVTSSLTTSMFVPSDPTLALDTSMGIAWHFGCEGIPLQAITVSIVKKLQTHLDAPRVVTWGGSGGGFAAIRVARDIPDSIALAWNPQTDIAKYYHGHVDHFRRIAFPAIAAGDCLSSDRGQFPSLCTDEFVNGYQGRIFYLQESTDWHAKAHLEPFLAGFCGKALSDIADSSKFSGFVTDQLYLHLDHWGEGHVPPSKAIISEVLRLLSRGTTDSEHRENLNGFPNDVVQYIASTVLQSGPVMKGDRQASSDQLGSASIIEPPLDYKEILSIRMDRIADDFKPFSVKVQCSGDRVALPLFTGEMMEVSLSDGVQWNRKFATQPNSSVMFLFSLDTIGKLLSTFQMRHDVGALQTATVILKSFLDYSNKPEQLSSLGEIPSADHSVATRVRVLIKFIQVMRERQDADDALLMRVCDCLKYWSDWLFNDKHYRKNNHGLMGSIALLHSAIQFGTAPYSKAYLDVATRRIIELGKSSFDRDGLCNENSIGYHNFNLKCYRELVEFCKHYRLSETLVNFLEDLILRATKALEFCVWQDSFIPPLGDSPVYRVDISSRNESRCFPESGFAVVKNNDLYLSIICGAPSEIHKQVDDSSITLRFRNRDILVDGGSYLYDRNDPYRRCVESSHGHTGLFLKEFDGLLRTEFVKQFGPVSGKIERFKENDDGVRIRCRYSVRDGLAMFVRNIFVCWPDEVAIVDSVEFSDPVFSSETVQRFLFGPTFDVRFHGQDKLILTSDEFSCTVFQLLDCNGTLYRGESTTPVRGWCSYKFQEILPTYGVDFMPISEMRRPSIMKLAKWASPSQSSTAVQFFTIIKLAKCAGLSECSTTVRAFASQVDPTR